MKKLMLLSLFIATSAYAQVGVGSLNERSVYDIGTGFSMNYFDNYMGVNVESLHFFRSVERPFDNVFLKVGMGANIDISTNETANVTTASTVGTDPEFTESITGFNFLTSIGYLYVQDQYHEKSVLSKFGTGATLDYSLIAISSEKLYHGVGITLYVVVNGFFIGIGGGAVIMESDEDESSEKYSATPYVNTSFAIAF